MKRQFFIFGGFVLLALTACVNEKISLEDQFAGEKITVKAYMPEGNTPSTRVSLNDNPTTTDKFELSWSEDDKFSVFSELTDEVVGPQNFEKTDLPYEFQGSELVEAEKYHAVYPVTSSTNPREIPFDISNQSNGLPFLMYASSEDGKSFKFNHALAYLKLKITVPLAYKHLDNNNKTRLIVVQLPGSYSALYPKGFLNIIDTDPNNKAYLDFDYDADPYILKMVTIECIDGENGNAVTIDGETVGYFLEVMFAIPPMSKYSAELKIFDESPINNNNYGATLEKGYGYQIEAGKYYTAEITLEKQVDDDDEELS